MSNQELAQVDVGPAPGVDAGDVLDLGTTGESLEVQDPEGQGGVEAPIGEESLFPPFDFEAFPSHLFWLAISFGILYFFVNRLVMPKVGGILEDRRDRIASDLGEASRLSRETDEVISAYEADLSAARQRAHAIAQARRDEIKAEQARQQAETEEALNKRIAEAEQEIVARRDSALADVDAIAADAARSIVERLSGIAVSESDAAKAVRSSEASHV